MKPKQKIIIGLGKTGLSCARFLAKQHHDFIVMDSRENPPGMSEFQQEFPDKKIILGKFDETLLKQSEELIVSPGISLKEFSIANAIAAGIPAIGDIELFARFAKAPVVGITGTNGKSTVTTLVGEMARDAKINVGVGGNLGTPALDLLHDTKELYVLELSSFQLETTFSLNLKAATILNIAPDHLDRYADLKEYAAAKQRIYLHCETPVINREDSLSYSGLKNQNVVISFGLNPPDKNNFGLKQDGKNIFLMQGNKILLEVNELQIKGRHQIANALAALALGTAIGLPLKTMLDTLRSFKGLPHRCQWVANREGVDWYNDSKGTNVSSSLAAIEGLGDVIKGKLILIAGGLGKQQDFSPLRPVIEKYVRTIILIGKDANIIASDLKNTVPPIFAKDMKEAVVFARQSAKPGDAVLLSPACASFDMFENFEHRGDVFMNLVHELAD